MTLALLALALVFQQADGPRVAALLEDGSVLMVGVPEGALSLKNAFGDLRVPWKDVRSLARNTDGSVLLRTSRSSVAGKLADADVALQATVGPLRLQLKEIRALVRGADGTPWPDGSALGLWTFTGPGRRKPAELVREREVTLSKYELSEDDDGVVSAARTERLGYILTEADEGLEIKSDEFTIEAHVKIGKVMSYAGILSKRNREREKSGFCDYSLLMYGNGAGMKMYGHDGRVHANFDARTDILDPQQWNYVAVSVRPRSVTVYVNGRKISESTEDYRAFSTGVPLHIGADPTGVTNYDGPERVRFVRLSNSARSEEEIRAVNALLSQCDGPTDPAWECAVQLRDGTVLRAPARTAQQLRFETPYGELAIPEGAAARLTLSPIRPGELARRLEGIGALIAQLGAADSRDREKAEMALLRMGGISLPLLIEAKGHADAEVAARATRLVDALMKKAVAAPPSGDALQAGAMTVRGWTKTKTLEVATSHGTYKVPVAEIRRITVKGADRVEPVLIRLRSGELMWGDFPAEASLTVETEFGKMEFPFAQLRGATFSEQNRCALRTDKVSTNGTAQLKELKFVTRAGTLTIPIESIQEISRPSR